MNSSRRRAGQSTYDLANKRHKSRVWLSAVVVAVVLFDIYLFVHSIDLGISRVGMIALFLFTQLPLALFSAWDRAIQQQERRAIRGARGEETIGSILNGLGEGFVVIHDVDTPFGNIDHIVISEKTGVFLIETKSHGGRVSTRNGKLFVNGHNPEKDFIRQVLKNTHWLRDKVQAALNMQVWVTPILVFTTAFVEPMPTVRGVTVVNKRYLLTAFEGPGLRQDFATIWEGRDRIQVGVVAQHPR